MSLFWDLTFLTGLQILLTLALHGAELIDTLSRDEVVWRIAISYRGTDPTYDLLRTATITWQNVGLLIFKPILHWIFGLSISVYAGSGVMGLIDIHAEYRRVSFWCVSCCEPDRPGIVALVLRKFGVIERCSSEPNQDCLKRSSQKEDGIERPNKKNQS